MLHSLKFIHNFASKNTMNTLDSLFFCATCKNKAPQEKGEAGCVMAHSVKQYKKGSCIAYQGDKVTALYILTKGKVKTEMVSDPGLTLPIEEIAAPYPLAAAFLFADNNRFPVDVIALEDVDLILISKETIEQQMAACPHFLRGFLAFSANRMQFLSERLKIFSLKGMKTKLAFYIVQHAKDGAFDLERSVHSLAEYFGVERPSLSRVLSEMVKDGVIAYKGGKGRILDYKALREML